MDDLLRGQPVLDATAADASTSAQSLSQASAALLSVRSALYEADIFAVLRSNPYVVRSFEFAIVDGGIFCGDKPAELESSYYKRNPLNYASRFSERFFQGDPKLSEFIPFDVKSTVGLYAEDQSFITSVGQKQHVAFYIGICAADTSFVMLIPNLQQEPHSGPIYSKSDSDGEIASVHTARTSWLDPNAYAIDPGYAPYAMPISLLPEAISRIRDCVRNGKVYTNPWSNVSFTGWTPQLRSSLFLAPLETSQHYTSLLAIREVQYAIKSDTSSIYSEVDFVWLQPRIADFKIISENGRQCFIQHKINSHERSAYSNLSAVEIGRIGSDGFQWYFTDRERFDFCMYEFTFKDYPRPRYEFFFLPERVIPNEFYTTYDMKQDFERSEFQAYRIVKDEHRTWASRILAIISANPQPRRPGNRPKRETHLTAAVEFLEQEPSTLSIQPKPPPAAKPHGRHDYKTTMAIGHYNLFYLLMQQCAVRASGLIVVLGKEHPLGDFGFLQYAWGSEEQQDFLTSGKMPRYIYQLPPETPIVPFYYYTHDAACNQHGPMLYSPSFRRLNSRKCNRLVIWDLFGSDERQRPCPLIVVPSQDIRLTAEQRQQYADTLIKRKNRENPGRDLRVSNLLCTGLYAADYVVEAGGPLAYNGDYSKLWELLYQFATSFAPIYHPKSLQRSLEPELYRYELLQMNYVLVEEDSGGAISNPDLLSNRWSDA